MTRGVFLFCLLCAGFATAQTIAVRAGNLIDPARGSVTKDQIILIRDHKITGVGTNLDIRGSAKDRFCHEERNDCAAPTTGLI